MIYEDFTSAYERFQSHKDYDKLTSDLEGVIIRNFPPAATCTKEYQERPIIIKQQDNAWKLFIKKELKDGVIWVGETLYRDCIRKYCFKDEGAAQRMFKYLGWEE